MAIWRVSFKSDMLPTAPGIGRFVDAVADGDINADGGFAAAGVDDVGVGRRHFQRADGRGREIAIADVFPVLAGIGGLPDAAADAAEIEGVLDRAGRRRQRRRVRRGRVRCSGILPARRIWNRSCFCPLCGCCEWWAIVARRLGFHHRVHREHRGGKCRGEPSKARPQSAFDHCKDDLRIARLSYWTHFSGSATQNRRHVIAHELLILLTLQKCILGNLMYLHAASFRDIISPGARETVGAYPPSRGFKSKDLLGRRTYHGRPLL